MAYTTIADVRAVTGLNDVNKVSDATITAKISFADATINAAIGSIYQLPLSASNDLVTFLSLELSAVMLEMDTYGEETQNLDKGWTKRMTFINTQLENIRQLQTRLFDSSGIELTRNTTRQPSGYPDAASSDPSAVNSTQAQLTMDATY